jgi:hypothetical protein
METKFDMNQWGYIKEKLRIKYPELTDTDLVWGHMSREDLMDMISNKIGITKKNLMDVIESL